ncbi:Uncharacterised protein [uncultured archaeon]|nr:Uncharacterised protein [uncultured archaeon]
MNAVMSAMTATSILPNLLMLFSKSVSAGASRMKRAVSPISVALPVATTTPTPEPDETLVPMNATQVFSCGLAAGAGSASTVFWTGADSPVRIDWFAASPETDRSRKSAGTTSPTSRCTMSPGTRLPASTSTIVPSRTALAFRTMYLASFSRVFSLLYSCAKPRAAETTRIPIITLAPV